MVFLGFIIVWFGFCVIQFIDIDLSKHNSSGFFSLAGAYHPKKDTSISIKSWHDGSYQQQKSAYLNESFFLRPLFVKLSNQYEYDLFEKINAQNIYQGKDGYLFRFYFDDYVPSMNYVGDDSVKNVCNRISQLQAILDSNNVKLITVIAPEKYRVCRKYLPENFKEDESLKPNNYLKFSEAFKKYQIRHLDFNGWFVQMQDTSSIPLFAKNGIHWTQSASFLALDSMQTYMEKLSGKSYQKLIRYGKHSKIKKWSPDVDISNTMNLLYPPDELDIPYYYVKTNDTTLAKPKVLIISDSFWDAPSWSGYTKRLYEKDEYWYYNKTKRVDNKTFPVTDKDYENLNQYEFVIIVCSEGNLVNLGWKFFENSLKHYQKD